LNENLRRDFKERPIITAFASVAVLWVLYTVIAFIVFRFFSDPSEMTLRYTRGLLRVIFSVASVWLLGYAVGGNGWRYAFTTRGLGAGLFAHLFFFAHAIRFIPALFVATEINTAFFTRIPAIILFDIGTGIFEEITFRGLLMTAMLIRFGATAKGRLACVLLNGAIFGLGHLIGGDWLAVLVTGILGMGFAAAYVYSKNLLACMLAHMAYNFAIQLTNGFIVDIGNTTALLLLQISSIVVRGLVLPFAIYLTIKAKPFEIYKALYKGWK